MKRVAITGLGPVAANGIGRESVFAAWAEGRSGIKDIASFDASAYPARRAGEIVGFQVGDYLESQKNYLDRASELAFAAMSLALEDADLDPKKVDGTTAGLLLGSAFGSLATMGLFFGDFLQKGPRLVKPVLFPHTYSNTAISLLAMEYNLSGYHANFASGAVSAACALVEGFDLIRQGRNPLVFAGGFEGFNEPLFAGYSRTAPGLILGEGAGILVLEEEAAARARGARIHGFIAGAGMTGGLRIADAMRLAMEQAGFAATGVDRVVSSANGSPELDRKEAEAIASVVPGAPVTGIKALIGETLGASGAFQVMAALGAMAAEGGIRRALVNVIDPGGSVVCLALQRTEA